MWQVVYTSRATASFRASDLDSILRASRRNNPALGVTGMLLFMNGEFMQALEGPDDNVRELYAKLQRDPRHTDCRMLREGPIEAREFPDWSMGFHDLTDAGAARPAGVNDFLDRPFTSAFYAENRSAARRLLSLFRLARAQASPPA